MFTTWKSFLLVLAPVWIALVGFYLGEDMHRNRFIPFSIDLLTLDTRSISNLLQNGSVTTVQLIEEYLHRIALDNVEGLGLRPILSLTSRDLLLREARQLDERSANMAPFEGNMATEAKLGMPTSAGAYALQNASATSDAFLIAKAREAGLLLMGKANLGSETMISAHHGPAWVEKPSLPMIARLYQLSCVLHCSVWLQNLHWVAVTSRHITVFHFLRLPAVFAKSAWDIASMLSVVSGPDVNDPITLEGAPYAKNFLPNLTRSWSDFRIGIVDRPWFWEINDGFSGDQEERDGEEKAELGAVIVDNVRMPSADLSNTEVPSLMGRIIRYEMKPGTEKFLQSLSGTNIKTLVGLVKRNQEHPDLAGSKKYPGEKYLERAPRETISDKEYEAALAQAHKLGVEEGLRLIFDKYDLDAIVTPAWTQMSIYAAWPGSPTATVPLGQYKNKKPYGLGFVGRRFSDEQLLQIMNLQAVLTNMRGAGNERSRDLRGIFWDDSSIILVPSCQLWECFNLVSDILESNLSMGLGALPFVAF
ncbi:amidase signature domain-containing protein [Leptodontidium sp. 2 PMI_412]|nr:amidase signature domain-containing protein [Leptodontidium sp. 2 PMI_412]